MNTDPILRIQAKPIVFLLPIESEEYPVKTAPITPPTEDAVLKATSQLAPMMYVFSK